MKMMERTDTLINAEIKFTSYELFLEKIFEGVIQQNLETEHPGKSRYTPRNQGNKLRMTAVKENWAK